jgi:TctA family transporter
MPRYWVTLLRSSVIGCWLGFTPGRRDRRVRSWDTTSPSASPTDPATFGKGRIEGVFAPETGGARGRAPSALLPMLALGIPARARRRSCSAADGVGLNPGPLLFVEHKDFVWG